MMWYDGRGQIVGVGPTRSWIKPMGNIIVYNKKMGLFWGLPLGSTVGYPISPNEKVTKKTKDCVS